MLDIREVRDPATGEIVQEVPLTGRLLLACSLLNKGSAFSEEERRELGLHGLLPPHVSTLEEQIARRYEEYRHRPTGLDHYLFLRDLQDRNETLFYALLDRHIAEMLPVIYTPEVGEACQRYSVTYHSPRGLFLPYLRRADLDAMLANRAHPQVDVIVATDGERILGLGDQGVGGMGIPIGKLALYTLCGGVHPGRTLPVLLDAGTDNPDLLQDPHYLGWRHSRVRGAQYDEFLDAFVDAVRRQLPGVLLQWEDFGMGNARRLLDRYRDRVCSFNDDIQGTGAVTLAALLSAGRVTGTPLGGQRVVVVGAGSASTGICDMLVAGMMREGLSTPDARDRLWLVDREGLLHTGLASVQAFQRPYLQPQERVAGWQHDPAGQIALLEVVRRVRPTVLLGVTGQPGLFTEEVVRTVAAQVERPAIFPLSNPTSRSEAVPVDLITWTEGRALVATGSPFPPVAYHGRAIPVSQCNNAYIFPGLGLGAIASGARRVTDAMFLAAAEALSAWDGSVSAEPALLPPLEEIRDVSRRIALAVGAQAMSEGVAAPLAPEEWEARVDALRWEPRYRRVRYRPG
jgi:malate dehydrogenase (oxaloacetate-decarboxylating)